MPSFAASERFAPDASQRRAKGSKVQAKPTDISSRNCWIWTGIFFLASEASTWVLEPTPNAPYKIGLGLGVAFAALFIAFLIAAIRRIFTKNGFYLTVIQTWGVFLVLSIASNFFTHSSNRADFHAAAQNMSNAMTGLPSSSSVSTQPTSEGDADNPAAGALNFFANAYRRHAIVMKKVIDDENSIPLGTVLLPSNLTSAAGIANGRDEMTHYGSDVTKFQDEINSYFSEIQSIINDTPPGTRENIQNGFNATNPKTMHDVSEYVVSERSLIDTTNAILDLGEKNLGVSRAKDGNIFLPHQALAEYRRLIKQLQANTVIEAKARADLVEQQQKSNDIIKKLLANSAPPAPP